MPANIGTAYVQILPSLQGIQGAMSSALQSAGDAVSASVGTSMGGGISNALGGALKAGMGAATAAFGAVSSAATSFAKTAIGAGQGFDASMSQVAATMGKSVDEISNLRDFAQEMGAATAFSASQAADALNYMALAGYSADQSMEMLPNVLNLAAAGGIDLATASDMVTDAQSALGLSFSESADMVNQMAKASSMSNTSVQQLGDAFLTIGATARGVKGGTVELAQVLGVLADNGIKGSEGGTHLRNAILSLQTPTKRGTEALAKLGMTYDDMYDAAGNMRSLPEIFQQLQSAMEGMDQQSKDAIVGGIFNKTDLASINALLGTNKERWDQLAEGIEDSSGAAQKMADTQLDNLAGDITLFQSALESAQIAVSDQLTPTLRDFVKLGSDGLKRVTDAFKDKGLGAAMKELGKWLSDALAKVTEMLPQIVKAGSEVITSLLKGILQNIPQVIDSAGEIMATIGNSLMESAPGMLKRGLKAVRLVIDGIAGALPEALPKIVEFSGKMGAALAQQAPKLLASLGNLFKSALQGVLNAASLLPGFVNGEGGFLEGGKRLVQSLTDGIFEAVPLVLDAIPELFRGISSIMLGAAGIIKEAGASLFGKLIEDAPSIISKIGSGLKEILTTVGGSLAEYASVFLDAGTELLKNLFGNLPAIKAAGDEALSEIMAGVSEAIATFVPVLAGDGTKLLGALFDGIPEITGMVAEKIPVVIDFVLELLSGTLPLIMDAGSQLLGKLFDSVPEIVAQISVALPQVIDSVSAFLLGMLPKILETGVGLLGKLFDNMPEIIGNLLNLLPQLIDSVVVFLAEAIPQIADAGVKLLGSLLENLPDIITKVCEAIPRLISSIIDAILELVPKIVQAGVDLLSTLFENLPAIVDALTKQIFSLIKSLVDVIKSKVGDFKDAGKHILNGLKDGILSAFNGVVDAVKNAAGNILGAIKGFFGIASPSKVLRKIGGYLMEGLEIGVRDFAKLPIGAVAAVSRAVEGAFSPTLEIGAFADNALAAVARARESAQGMFETDVATSPAQETIWRAYSAMGGTVTADVKRPDAKEEERPINLNIVGSLDIDGESFGRISYKYVSKEARKQGNKLSGKVAFSS